MTRPPEHTPMHASLPAALATSVATSVEASYRWCEQKCRASRSSFLGSFSLLAPHRRNAMYALYAFSRITDDLGDGPGPADERRKVMYEWRRQAAKVLGYDLRAFDLQRRQAPSNRRESVNEVVAIDPWRDHPTSVLPEPFAAAVDLGTNPRTVRPWPLVEIDLQHRFDPLWPALVDAQRRFSIPHRYLDDIIVGVGMDIDHQPPRDWDELRNYCYHVASAVGLACTCIWQDGATIPRSQAIDCGIAFQLTNILRDIAEDARAGRIYLPLDELDRFSVNPAAWLQGRPDGCWIELIKHVGKMAEQLYASGWEVIHVLSPDSRRMFSLMWRSYHRLLSEVVSHPQRLWGGRRIQLPWRSKTWLLASHLTPFIYSRLPAP